MMLAPRLCRRLRADRRGVTVVEFAILAPVMLYLLCGALELGHMIFARQVLEGAMVEGARVAAASMESTEAQRRALMVRTIRSQMSAFPLATGRSISIRTTVYADFSSAYPETYTDTNKNNARDIDEPYVDRNRNGQWDPATPKTGTMGGPGDVVAYTLRFPKQALFEFVVETWGVRNDILMLNATTVVRNEATVRSGA